MGLKIKVLALILAVTFLYFILRALKNNVMRPSQAVLWVAIPMFLISIPVFEPFYKWIAVEVVGITDARHIIYIALIGFLLVYNFYLTRSLSQLSGRVQHLLSSNAILDAEVRRISADSTRSS